MNKLERSAIKGIPRTTNNALKSRHLEVAWCSMIASGKDAMHRPLFSCRASMNTWGTVRPWIAREGLSISIHLRQTAKPDTELPEDIQ